MINIEEFGTIGFPKKTLEKLNSGVSLEDLKISKTNRELYESLRKQYKNTFTDKKKKEFFEEWKEKYGKLPCTPFGTGDDACEIHHIEPLSYGGNPTDEANFVLLPKSEHKKFSSWWQGNNFEDNIDLELF